MTAKTEVEFRIAGPCLSFLLCDCESSKCDQMGFLIGEKSSVTTQIVSDEDMDVERINTTITINGSYPIGLPFVFCSSLGRVDETLLKEVLGCLQKDVLGWYSFRRNCNHNISMRENFLHKELLNILEHVPPEYFIFCLITSAETDRSATHSKRFTFFTQKRRRFHPVSVVQTNLGEPEDNVYKKSTIVDDSSKHLQQILSSINETKTSRESMTTLHSKLKQQVNKLQNNVTKLQAVVETCSSSINSSNISCSDASPKSWKKDESASTSSCKNNCGRPTKEH